MAEILGIGLTHFPPLAFADERMGDFFRRALERPHLPAALRDPAHWPARLRAEWKDPVRAAAHHRGRLVEAFRRVRAEIDAFRPDLVLIWGDDQYENFQEDGIPPYAVFVADEIPSRPWLTLPGAPPRPDNVWGEPADTVFPMRGHRQAAKHLTTRLLEQDFDAAYAYRARHPRGAPHAHMHTLLYLDYDRKGWDHPLVLVHVNSFGSAVIAHRGGPMYLRPDAEPDPPSPGPRRFFDLGAATARILAASPWRAVLMASGSWSHAFLTAKHHCLWPDSAFDRARLEELERGDIARWRDLTYAEIADAGEQEFMQWACLAGAMSALGRPRAEVIDYVETDLFNSTKCFAVFRPASHG
jgi:hypothetical protein